MNWPVKLVGLEESLSFNLWTKFFLMFRCLIPLRVKINKKKGAVFMYTLVGTKNVDFKGSDGAQVNGMNLYFTYEDPEVDTRQQIAFS